MHRQVSATAIATLVFLFAGSPCFGQALPKEKQAELAFEIRLDKLRDSPIYKMAAGNFEQMRAQANISNEIDINKINRVWGAIAIPETMAEASAMQGLEKSDPLPFEMFVHMEFADEATLDEAMKKIVEESETLEINGTTYYKPAGEAEAPANMLATRLNSTTMQVGTEGYITGETGEAVYSSGLSDAWDVIADDPIRLAFDLENSRELVNELVEAGKANLPGMAGGMLDLLGKTSNLRISMDFDDGGNLLTIGATGTDEEKAEEVRAGLDGLLALAKMGGGQMVEGMRQRDEGTADVLAAIMDSLRATRDGTNVQIAVPKPEGFEDAIQKLMKMNGGGDF